MSAGVVILGMVLINLVLRCPLFLVANRVRIPGIVQKALAHCPVPGVGPETPADRDYEGGFAAALMLKDLRLAMEAAQSVDAYTPMGSDAEELYTRFAEKLGGANKDFSAIIKMIDDSWTAPEGTKASPPPPGLRMPD